MSTGADFHIEGSGEFRKLARALDEIGQRDLRRAVQKGLDRAVEHYKPLVARKYADAMPARLRAKADHVAQVTQVHLGPRPGVTVRLGFLQAGGLSAETARMVDELGVFRHPVFKTGRWVAQPAPKGRDWFREGWHHVMPAAKIEIEKELAVLLNVTLPKKVRGH